MSDEPIAEGALEDSDHIIVTLSTPIKAYGDELSVIKMRKPTAGDGIRVGNPVDFIPFTNPPSVRFNMPILQAMIAHLARIPSGSIEKMAPNDLISCGWILAPFFLPNPGT
jgi:hypothetical protein